MTIGFVVLLLECALIQLLQTERADEVLGVELAVHRGYAPAGDRLMTARAQRTPFRVIVGLAVGLTLVVEETAAVEGRTTILLTTQRQFVSYSGRLQVTIQRLTLHTKHSGCHCVLSAEI